MGKQYLGEINNIWKEVKINFVHLVILKKDDNHLVSEFQFADIRLNENVTVGNYLRSIRIQSI